MHAMYVFASGAVFSYTFALAEPSMLYHARREANQQA